ncbi:MAG: hypothetical protein ABSE73_04770 [Planctomycetota bacterium]
MTLIVAGLVSKRELFLGADSRLSSGTATWDYATKIFRLYPTEDYVAYCGQSLQALLAISQGLQLLANTSILGKSGSADTPQITARAAAFFDHMQEIMTHFPPAWGKSCELLMAGYNHRLKRPSLYRLALGTEPKEPAEIPMEEQWFECMGSGASLAEPILKARTPPKSGKDVYDTVYQVIEGKKEATVGGCVQMAVIREGSSRTIGFQMDQALRVVMGFPARFASGMPKVLWFDPNFKRVRASQTVRRHMAKRAK